ncbi:MAG TPA: Na-translocating system protein MpsC family protein [Solirubrobacteraceae bacterium]|nr:Na-translocating system protein MpsC family protein [Solirubrobacteraceae bacterium]
MSREQHSDTQRSPAMEISNTVVHLMKEHTGKGPPKCRTYVQDELVTVLMRGGFSQVEQTLFEAGKWIDVRSGRQDVQDTLAARFIEAIEKILVRKVIAFMSASHQDPDLQVELFLLEPHPEDGLLA